MGEQGTVYLIHFDRPLAHARHYMGWTSNLRERLQRHREGSDARLMQVVQAAGISWRVSRTWPGGRSLERKLKRQKNGPRLCPICRAQARGEQLAERKSHGEANTSND